MCLQIRGKREGNIEVWEVKGRFAGPRLRGPKSLECYQCETVACCGTGHTDRGLEKNVITGKPGRRARGKGPHSNSHPGKLGRGETEIGLKHGQSHIPFIIHRFYDTLSMKPPDRTCCPWCFSPFVLLFLLSVFFLFFSSTGMCRSERDTAEIKSWNQRIIQVGKAL